MTLWWVCLLVLFIEPIILEGVPAVPCLYPIECLCKRQCELTTSSQDLYKIEFKLMNHFAKFKNLSKITYALFTIQVLRKSLAHPQLCLSCRWKWINRIFQNDIFQTLSQMVKPLGTIKEPFYLKIQHHQTFMFNGRLSVEDQQLLFRCEGPKTKSSKAV